jgi:hypothetical protein
VKQSDPRSRDAGSVLRELNLTGEPISTETVQTPVEEPDSPDWESSKFVTDSAFIRAAIWMAQADEDAAKAGREPFKYENEDERARCRAWLEGWRRARTEPQFWDLFDRLLSSNCKSLLGFDSIPRPEELAANV